MRAFDAPLFGSDQTTFFRFLASQSLPDVGDFNAWSSGGPDNPTYFGFSGKNMPLGESSLGFSVGDFVLESLHPDDLVRRVTDAYALQGASAVLAGRHATVRIFRWPFPICTCGTWSAW